MHRKSMIMLTLLLASTITQTTTVEIINVDRHETTVGRRGNRVTESWQVKAEGKTLTIDFTPYHDRMTNTPKAHKSGDKVQLNLNLNQKATLKSGGSLHLQISAVKD